MIPGYCRALSLLFCEVAVLNDPVKQLTAGTKLEHQVDVA